MANEKRLIYLDEAIARIKDDGILGTGYSDNERIDDVCDMLESCPTVDAAPVVHGRWLYDCGSYRIFCSACDKNALERKHTNLDGVEYAEEILTDYCPNCGAKMDGDGNA